MNRLNRPESIPDWQLPHPSDLPTADRRQPADCESSQQPPNVPTIEHPAPDARLIPLEQIVPNPHQPRRDFDDDALLELAESIAQKGVLQPILLRQIAPDHYQIIAGERRYRASQLNGLPAIPAIIHQLDDREQAEIALIENLQREDLNPVETARAFHTLLNRFGIRQKELSQRVGKSQSVISRFLQLLELPEEILSSLERDEIQEGHARALLRIENKLERDYVWQQLTTRRLSVRETERIIRTIRNTSPELLQRALETNVPPPDDPLPIYTHSVIGDSASDKTIMNQLSHQYLTHVTIRRYGTQGGHLEIRFIDDLHLQELVGTLKKQAA